MSDRHVVDEDGELFPQEGYTRRIAVGDVVDVQTIYGDEHGTVVELGTEDGFPMVTLDTESGDRITVSIARVR